MHRRRQSSTGLVQTVQWSRLYNNTLAPGAHLDTQPSRLPIPVGRHPGHCLLVRAPSALDPSSGEALFTVTGSGQIVVQLAADFLVGGSNPGQVHMPAAPPMAFDWQGFEPPTAKTAAGCAAI